MTKGKLVMVSRMEPTMRVTVEVAGAMQNWEDISHNAKEGMLDQLHEIKEKVFLSLFGGKDVDRVKVLHLSAKQTGTKKK